MKQLFIFFLLIMSSGAFGAIGRLSKTINDPSRNRNIETDIYYPATLAGDNVPALSGNYPVLVWGHGFVMNVNAYMNIVNALVDEGYIIALPKTEGSLSPNHLEFARDLLFLVNYLTETENNTASSILFQSFSGTAAIGGHSMGGGCSVLAAELGESNTHIKTIVNFAAANTNPSAITAAAGVAFPVLLFAGANDCVTPIAVHQQPIYNALISSCKVLVTITGASHCYFADNSSTCSFGELTCSPPPAISRSEQHTRTFNVMKPWLDIYLKNAGCTAVQQIKQIWNSAEFYQLSISCPTYTTAELATPEVAVTQTTCGLSNGIAQGLATGGQLPYHYQWSNGSTNETIEQLIAGTYAVTVTDQIGCTATNSTDIAGSVCPKVNSQPQVTNITSGSVQVNWSGTDCATKYRVTLKNNANASQITYFVSAPATGLTLNGLLPNTTYQVRIRTQCSQNGSVLAQLSPIASFTTLNSQGIQCLPPANVSVSNITTTSAQINWTLLSGAIQYNLRYRKVGTSPWTTIVLSGTANTATLQNLTASGSYEFQIRSKCNSNPDEFSPYSALNVFNTLSQRIEETESLSTLIYPNPTNTNINVVINAVGETQTTIRITDLLGRVMLNETEALIGGNNTITYNIGDYASGVYLIHVGNGNTQQVFKVVKE